MKQTPEVASQTKYPHSPLSVKKITFEIVGSCLGNLPDIFSRCIDEQIAIITRAPFPLAEIVVISRSAFVDGAYVSFHFEIGQVFVFGTAFTTAFQLAFHIRIYKNTEWILFPQNIVGASPYDYTIGLYGQFLEQTVLLRINAEVTLQSIIGRVIETHPDMYRV